LRYESATMAVDRKAVSVFAPGQLGELTQILDVDLIDAVAAETATVQKRIRILPTRVVIYFVLALALFDTCGYRQVWAKLVAGLGDLRTARPSASGLCRARRRVGPAPLRALFEAVSGPVAEPGTTGVFWRSLRLVAIDATTLHVASGPMTTTRYRLRSTGGAVWGYPLLRLSVLIECGTRAIIDAAFGPDTTGELAHARQLLNKLTAGMLLLADAGYDSTTLFADITATGASYLCRSGAQRTPLIATRLPDGSYLAVLVHGRTRLPVRIIEARITTTLADTTTRTEDWRLITNLLDHTHHPARELVTLYHQRWQIETTYLSIKSTILHGRVLRSHHPADIDQEVYALLTIYQTIIRITTDATTTITGLDPHRASFTIALDTARNQVITATGIHPHNRDTPTHGIAHAVLAHLHPARHRSRIKARTRKNAVSKYQHNKNQHPQKAQTYTIHTHIGILDNALTARPRR